MTDEKWRQLVREIRALGVAESLAADHVPDESGRYCRGCRSHSVQRVFPCALRELADAAKRDRW